MKYLIRALAAVVLLAIVVSSCSDAGLLLPVERNAAGIEIMSITEGSVLMTDDTFEVALEYDEEEAFPDRMIIELLNSIGEVQFSVELEQEDILQLPQPVLLPEDLADGIYTVSVTVFEEEKESATDTSLFFYITQDYEIDAIAAYPQIFYPGGSGLVLADLSVPEGSDPYMRWSLAGEIVSEGLLSSGSDALQLDVPEKEGVISILLEIFPFGPAVVDDAGEAVDVENGESLFEFSSVISLEAQFFVSSFQEVDEFELGPEEHYYSLFHFRGETIDWGFHGNGGAAEAIGSPGLAIGESVFGYLLDGASGFSIEEVLLPFESAKLMVETQDAEATADSDTPFVLQPFSFSERFVLMSATGSLFLAEDSSGQSLFKVGFDESGGLRASVGESESTPALAELTYGYNDLTVTVIPEETTIRFLWFVNGVLEADEILPYQPVVDPGAGRTIIGGREGFRGIVDEVGIYHRVTEDGSQVDSEVFTRAMERIFGDDLILAEGFDGTHLPEHLAYDTEAGEYIIGGGSLFLPPGGSVQFEAVPENFESLTITVETPEGGQTKDGVLILETEDGEQIVIEIDEAPSTDVKLVYSEGSFTLTYGENSTAVKPVGELLTIRNRSGSGGFELRSILVIKNQYEE